MDKRFFDGEFFGTIRPATSMVEVRRLIAPKIRISSLCWEAFWLYNIHIGPMISETSLYDTEAEFKRYAHAKGYTALKPGRITVQGKDHIWARYHMGNRDWTKKYMIVFGETEYAITATCFDQQEFLKKERIWDEIAASFRLLTPIGNIR